MTSFHLLPLRILLFQLNSHYGRKLKQFPGKTRGKKRYQFPQKIAQVQCSGKINEQITRHVKEPL
jgi:hypothetical protein